MPWADILLPLRGAPLLTVDILKADILRPLRGALLLTVDILALLLTVDILAKLELIFFSTHVPCLSERQCVQRAYRLVLHGGRELEEDGVLAAEFSDGGQGQRQFHGFLCQV